MMNYLMLILFWAGNFFEEYNSVAMFCLWVCCFFFFISDYDIFVRFMNISQGLTFHGKERKTASSIEFFLLILFAFLYKIFLNLFTKVSLIHNFN